MARKPLKIVRVYEDPGRVKGEYRALVDRLWPRGLAKTAVDHDEWAKDVAPSADLRRWYGHVPDRFPGFCRRYQAELGNPPAAQIVSRLAAVAEKQQLILLTATRDVEHSGAAVLQLVLES